MLPPFPRAFHPPTEVLISELLYFVIVGALCLTVYFKTRDIYNLSRHRGLHHFRNIFLFFSLSYLFRLLQMAIMLWTDLPRPNPYFKGMPFLFIGYFSTMAVISVAMAALPERMRKPIDSDILLNLVAVIFSIAVFLTRSHELMLVLQTGVFAISVALMFIGKRTSISKNRVTYLLLFIFWVINMLLFGRMLRPTIERIPFYLLSILLFFWIFWRVIRRLSYDKKKG